METSGEDRAGTSGAAQARLGNWRLGVRAGRASLSDGSLWLTLALSLFAIAMPIMAPLSLPVSLSLSLVCLLLSAPLPLTHARWGASHVDLAPPADPLSPVHELTSATFNESLASAPAPWALVEFYAHWFASLLPPSSPFHSPMLPCLALPCLALPCRAVWPCPVLPPSNSVCCEGGAGVVRANITRSSLPPLCCPLRLFLVPRPASLVSGFLFFWI
jgi:hypothetical protein